MTPFLVENSVSMIRMKQLLRWVKRMKKFGAYLEAEELESGWLVNYIVLKYTPIG